MIKKNYFLILFVGIILYFFLPFLLHGLLPIPADTIVGLYNPYRDLYAVTNPHGIAYKNFLITDPVRQIYPWKNLAVQILKSRGLPLWNPYEMAGTPLAANFQSSPYYPLNIFLLMFPFAIGWSILVLLQPLLAGLFLYLYLRNLKLSSVASILGAVAFAFCGFSVAWLEWNTIVQTAMWLPLMLLSVDKIESGIINYKFWKNRRQQILWFLIFLFSIVSSFCAGHLQIFFYVFVTIWVYFFFRLIQDKRKGKFLTLFLILNLLFIILTFFQWFPTLQFILYSARTVDQANWMQPGWFLPWQNLAQFLVPDFFGNPTTLNYWGIWNYGEFVGYIGIIPFFMALLALLFRRDKKTFFFGILLLVSMIFILPTPIATLPFIFHIPFLSTAQPTRLMFIIDFSLVILAALGTDYFLRKLERPEKIQWNIIITSGIIALAFGVLWGIVIFNSHLFKVPVENLIVTRRNLLFQTLLLVLSLAVLILYTRINRKRLQKFVVIVLLLVVAADVVRFAQKFEPFSKKEYLYPQTKSLSFLSQQRGTFRIAATDSRILPPNFSTTYKLQSVEGYNPLYLLTYGEYISALERNKPNISGPFGFNRIITPRNISSPLFDLLNVKYILSFQDLDPTHFTKVFQEGETKVFENKKMIPRVFFVKKVRWVDNKNEAIQYMFDHENDLANSAVVEKTYPSSLGNQNYSIGAVTVIKYSPEEVILETENSGDGFLVFTDSYYPTWHDTIISENSSNFKVPQEIRILKTDYNFRGIFVPKGKNKIIFYNSLFSDSDFFAD